MIKQCIDCQDTGMIYNEGVYGWDYGGFIFCCCPKGIEEENKYIELNEKEIENG